MSHPSRAGQTYLIGAGIASLAAAAYLIRDAHVPGRAIHIFDESDAQGGSLDAGGSPATGYRLRGGRMFEYAYLCTYDLLSFIPSLTDPALTVLEEIRSFNRDFPTSAKARLMTGGRPLDASAMLFAPRDRIALIEMTLRPEDSLHAKRIDECFDAAFFQTNFWYLWATTFAFEPWHSAVEFKRYLHRFVQEFSRISTLSGVERTPYNQYDSIVRPLTHWLEARGVTFETNARVTELGFAPAGQEITVASLRVRQHGTDRTIAVESGDAVVATVGSMTAGSSWGSMTEPAVLDTQHAQGAWELWQSIARDRPAFGRPDVFNGRVEESTWISFTITFSDRAFFDRLQALTGTALATFKDSNWLLSLVLAHQPHFIGQPDEVAVAWGYGLFADREGNFVKKAMRDCSGEDIMREVLGHLRLADDPQGVIDSSICLPCLMPFITSQFLTRRAGDRPAVIPAGSTNLALIGQYVEIADDTVFTVEYSVRAAQMAVIGLFRLDREPTKMYDGTHDPAILRRTLETLMS